MPEFLETPPSSTLPVRPARGSKHRFLIYLEIANPHRFERMVALAQTLIAGGHETTVAFEREITFRFSPADTKIEVWNADASALGVQEYAPGLKLIPISLPSDGTVEILEVAQEQRAKKVTALISEFKPTRIILWNGDFEFQKGTLEGIRQADMSDKVIFAEVAWLPQQEHLYFDTQGVNSKSTLASFEYRPLTDGQRRLVKEQKRQFRALRSGRTGPQPHPDLVFVPMQIETDTSFRIGSPFRTNNDFVAFLERWIPGRSSANLKLHPKDRVKSAPAAPRRKDFRLISSGSLDRMLLEAEHVVGINSTVLIEAAMLDKHTVAFGKGIFTGSGAMIEASPDQKAEDVLGREIDPDARDRFLYEILFHRQISLASLKKHDYQHLASREPFQSIFDEPSGKWGHSKWLGKVSKGEAMIKMGNSRVARTAVLDVEKGGEITVGDDSEIRNNAVLEVTGRYNGSISIGNHSVIGIGSWLQGSGKIDIGDDVIIGPYAAIVSTNHQYEDVSVPVARQPLTTGEIAIENDVWLGAHVTVALNVRIGAHSIIGANSFVNSDIPPYSIAVGSPARVIRSRRP